MTDSMSQAWSVDVIYIVCMRPAAPPGQVIQFIQQI